MFERDAVINNGIAELNSDPPRKKVAGKAIKLGKKTKKDDPRNLKLAEYVDRNLLLPARPTRSFYGYKVDTWPMYANDRLGDCTCATLGHMEQCFSSFTVPETPSVDAVLEMYWGTGSEDDGRYSIDVLNRWRNTGFEQQIGGREKILAYAELDVLDIELVKTASWLFGGLYIGIGLPITAQQDTDEGRWVYHADAPSKERAFGSWGGHAVNVVAWSDYNLWLITWGQKIKMSWAFWKHYVDEAYAVVSPDWFNKTGLSPSGFNMQALLNDVAQI